MIIDAHAHYGHDFVFDEDNFEEELLTWYDRCGIDRAIIQPSVPRPYLSDTIQIHNEIFSLCKKYNGRFWGMASINPHFSPLDYEKELTRCVRELGFVGVKISPIGHAAHPSLSSCFCAYEVCLALDIPVMIHTGPGAPFADPLNLIKPAKAFPKLRFIIAHAGTDVMFSAALYVAQQCENVFLEPSWLNVYSLREAITSLGASRVMFSSDMPMNVPVELAKYEALSLSYQEREQVMYKTAVSVFNLKV